MGRSQVNVHRPAVSPAVRAPVALVWLGVLASAGCGRGTNDSEPIGTVSSDLNVGNLSISGAVITPKGGVVGAIVDLGGTVPV